MTALRTLAAAGLLALAGTAPATPPPAFDDAPLRAVQFVDANEGWAAGDDGVVWHTIDGGKSWERQKTGTRASLRGVHFLTPYTGWAAGRVEQTGGGSGGVLLATTDGGLTWTETAANLLPGLAGVRFFDEQSGVVYGDGGPAYPGGVFHTRDGGRSWRPVAGPLGPGWLAGDFPGEKAGFLAGRWGKAAHLADGRLSPADLDIPGGRAVRAVKVAGKRAVLVGDGGMVLVNRDWPAGAWEPAELPAPREARAVCDFHAVAAAGDKLWVAGRPGSVVFFSPDFGKSWEAQRTPTALTIHALTMISETTGWAVGDLGTILGTTDGGKTWAVRRTSGQRAAVLFAHAEGRGLPVGVLPSLGRADGYLITVVRVTSSDPATADPRRAAAEDRLAAAVRSAGGAASEGIWSFPLPGHCDGLSPQQLLAFWDGYQGGKGNEQLLRRMVLAIRTWRPDVIVTDSVAPTATAAEQVVRAAIQEAFKLAADPSAFPEQMAALGLQPHAAKKLYGTADAVEPAQVTVDAASFSQNLADAPRYAADEAARLLGADAPAKYPLRLLAHRLDGAEKHAGLTGGCDLARGGTARRDRDARGYTPEHLGRREAATKQRADFEAFAGSAFAKDDADFEPLLKQAKERLAAMPDDVAAEALADAAGRLARAGRWTLAREFYAHAADRYPTLPASAAALRWLPAFHASAEAVRRVEHGDCPPVAPLTFVKLPPVPAATPDVQQAGFTEPVVAKTLVKFRTTEARRNWLMTGPDAEPKLFAVNPLAARDPAAQLAFHAARLRVGLTADAEKALTAYHWATVGGAFPAGANPWFDAVASELWLLNRGASPAPPKPLAGCRKTSARPHLDGKLDDDCWKAADVLPVAAGPADLAGRYRTEARFAFDDAFLYVAVTCGHPDGDQVPQADARRRDDDLHGHDRIDILLDLDRDYGTYYRLRVDHRGCVAEDCWGDRTWNPKWFVAVNPTPTGWAAEVAIPLAELTADAPRHLHVWAANVVRVLPGRGVLAWSGPADAAPRPEGLGLLEFRAK